MDNPTPTLTPSSSTTPDIGAANPNNRDQFLRHLNKLSHKISKPSSSSSFNKPGPPEPTPPPSTINPVQPPVYNINKSDFRDVVQRLTGSPAHAPPSSPPVTHAPKPSTSSRLHRIRPPPLAQISLPNHFMGPGGPGPHSPLPPLPSCHASAESPISAYMRFMHNTTNMNMNMMTMFPPPENFSGSSAGSGVDCSSFGAPLTFGCLPSPKSPCPLLSPKMMMPPLSPTVPGVPSPK